MPCSTCYEITMPDCVTTIVIDGAFDGDYILVLTDHFGHKQVLNESSNYVGVLVIDVEDLPDGYFFGGNSYTLKIYSSQENFECDDSVAFCTKDCILIEAYRAEGHDETFTINCCE